MNLHPRTQSTDAMKAEAHRILDAARDGLNIDEARITWALRITGDLE